ncbi:MAG: hypothetical protein WBA93_35260 [Microcoleaceae cyanobacterium]
MNTYTFEEVRQKASPLPPFERVGGRRKEKAIREKFFSRALLSGHDIRLEGRRFSITDYPDLILISKARNEL